MPRQRGAEDRSRPELSAVFIIHLFSNPRVNGDFFMVKTSKKSILSMEELLASAEVGAVGLQSGQTVKGKITAIKNKGVFIDIGGKTDAVVMGKELEYVRDFIGDLKLGDEIEVLVKHPENDRGQILVSIRGAAMGFGWQYFEEKLKSGGELTVTGRELNRGGTVVMAPFGFFGFIPGSQIGSKYDNDPEKMLGKKIKVKVLEVDQAKNRLVFSERLVSEPEKVGEEFSAIDKIEIGSILEAEIVRVEPFGIFVKIYPEVSDRKFELEGLVHISEISWEKVDNVQTMYKAKDKIQVKLINKDEGRLQFSVKRLKNDPWESIEEKYPKDKECEGVVIRLAAYGALVRLETAVEGLVHISKLNGGVELHDGEKVQVYIESIDVPKRKISLGLVNTGKKVLYK